MWKTKRKLKKILVTVFNADHLTKLIVCVYILQAKETLSFHSNNRDLIDLKLAKLFQTIKQFNSVKRLEMAF